MVLMWLLRSVQRRVAAGLSQRIPAVAVRCRFCRLHLEALEDRTVPSTFLVTNAADFGAGSLRQAILDANATPETNTIAFAIGAGGVQTIRPSSALPTITRPVTIDGATEPGFADAPLIVLDGSGAGFLANGLTITAGNSTVKGLVIEGFSGSGVELRTLGGNVIAGNYLGTDVTGTQALGNARGVLISGGVDNLIGGTTAAERNVISGNITEGIFAIGTRTLVQGNYIGTDVTGTAALGNSSGLLLIGVDNTVGGTADGAGNLISGNRTDGVDTTGTRTLVLGNFIGTDFTGTRALGNGGRGVGLFNGGGPNPENGTVGGTQAGARNVISGNAGDGVSIFSVGNALQGNLIGTDVTGTRALGNNTGVSITSGMNNTIGGAEPGAGNLISGNTNFGVQVAGADSRSNALLGNFIGTDVTGSTALRNSYGVYISAASGTTVGGTAAGAGNLISGNFAGVVLFSASGNRVQGNRIGTDRTGTASLGSFDGVEILSGSGNTIGGAEAGAGNLISGNTNAGVLLLSSGNQVQGNTIGVDATGAAALRNTYGVYVETGSDNTIGGTVAGAGNTISGNTLYGILIAAGSGNQILGNLIGTDALGTAPLRNGTGVLISGSGNAVGDAGTGNTISGNNTGVVITGNGNRVLGNFIGTNAGGTATLPNSDGVSVSGSDNRIGGTAAGAGNLISGNDNDNVVIDGNGNVVQGNYIGTDVSGTRALRSGFRGVGPPGHLTADLVINGSNNTIGGTVEEARNLISGSFFGIDLRGDGNLVQGNSIGTDLRGTEALGNDVGVNIGGSNNVIGGTEVGAGNLISGLVQNPRFLGNNTDRERGCPG
jgi:Periplasmic copper-binding protein (NosD)